MSQFERESQQKSQKYSALERLWSAIKNPQKQNPKHMKINVFGKRVSLSFYEKKLISVKRKKK